ncbi:MAG: translation elongation factor 4 [Dehalococcoidia bacterium]|nr:translation elongation factor 4 [Dehalococcoidia bacterium]
MEQALIRNLCIIAHIDHGKSTLADRLLEATGTINPRDMEEQVLDQMDLERERGITIKAQAVRMAYRAKDGIEYELNLIDTPGHVDFNYEVSRSLAACEGAILVVDATQGIEAQTIANTYLALEQELTLIPVINKTDLPNANPDRVAAEISDLLGVEADGIMRVSAKEGWGVPELLEAIVARVPAPQGDPKGRLRALIFDSKYDSYKGVIAYVRVMDGVVTGDGELFLVFTGKRAEALEIGVFRPKPSPVPQLSAGEVGYIATGLKNVKDCQVGDTVTLAAQPAESALPGYRPIKPMVFAGLYPVDGNYYSQLRDALDKLKLNDAALVFEPENSVALGFGFRCGFLGTLHMEIVQERLEREYELELIATTPSVAYHVTRTNGTMLVVDNPSLLPSPNEMIDVQEPWMSITIHPSRYIGPVMDMLSERRAEFVRMDYLDVKEAAHPDRQRVMLVYNIPMSEILVEFHDQLKSISQGFASLDYAFLEYRAAPLVRLDILVNEKPVDALSRITHRDDAQREGKALVEKLRTIIPRQQFEVPIQAAVGGKVIARENIKSLRKDVLARMSGGDVTRKRKLLEKQAKGKKRMKRVGNVDIPQEAFLAVLKRGQ